MAPQSSCFIIRSLATSIERSVLLVGRSVLLYDGWCLCVDLSGHGHPEGAEVWTGSDMYAVQSPSREPSREIRVPQPTSPAQGDSATASPSKDRHTVISLFEIKFLIIVFQ